MRRNPGEDEDLDLERLFDDGEPFDEVLDATSLVPISSMPLLDEVVIDTPSMGPPTEETGELSEIPPEVDDLRVGQLVQTPDGRKMKIQWINPTKGSVGLGKKRGGNYVFYSFAEVRTLDGAKINVARKEEQKKADAAEGQSEESTDVYDQSYMPEIPMNEDGKPIPYPYQIETINFVMKPKSLNRASTGSGGAFAVGSQVTVVGGPNKEMVGRVYWSGKSKRPPYHDRYGIKTDDGQAFFEDAPFVRAHAHEWNGAIIGDEMGLGKTLSAIVCMESPCVAVVPALLKQNWAREIAMWRPTLTVAVIEGRRPELVDTVSRAADVIVINYDVLDAHVEWLSARRNKTLVADEAHYLKTFRIKWDKTKRANHVEVGPGKTSRRTKAFYDLRMAMPKDGRPILLTGTPILNRTKELFPLLFFLDPVVWGAKNSQLAFWRRYCGGHKTRFGYDANGRTNTQELNQRLVEHYMVRHTKEQVLVDLPEKKRSTMEVSLTPDYQNKYIRAARDFLSWVKSNGGAEAVAKASRALVLTKLTALRRLSAIGKSASVVNYIVEFFVSTQRPLVVMGVHKDAFAKIEEGINAVNEAYRAQKEDEMSPIVPREIRYAKVVGGMNASTRQKAIDDFQDGHLDVILYSIPIATGTTLTRSQDMLFFERMWRPADQVQAEDRIHRIGQQNAVSIVYMDGSGTIDAKMGMMLQNKSSTFAGVIDGVELSTEMSAMLVFGEMIGSVAGWLDGIEELLGNVEDMDERVAEQDGLSDNPRAFERLDAPRVLFDGNMDWLDTYGAERHNDELIPNLVDDVTEEALDSWWDPQ